MGSFNRDGSPIEQKREGVRQLGKAYTVSADRVESLTKVTSSGILGPQLNVGTAQLSTMKVYECVKVARATDDTKVSLVCNSGLL